MMDRDGQDAIIAMRGESYGRGVKDGRARVRRELLAWIDGETPGHPYVDTRSADHIWEDEGKGAVLASLRAALDRICPQEPEP